MLEGNNKNISEDQVLCYLIRIFEINPLCLNWLLGQGDLFTAKEAPIKIVNFPRKSFSTVQKY